MRTLALALALALALVAGCATTSVSVGARALAHGQFSGIHDARRLVITDNETWQRVWTEHAQILPPPAPAPAVNFANETVIAVFLGNEPDACWNVTLGSVGADGDTLNVTIVTTAPIAQNVACAQIVTQPFVMSAFSGSFERGRVVFVNETRATQAAPS